MPDADDGVVGHLGPGNDVNVPAVYTHELILTRNEGELARQAAYTPLSRAQCVRALHAGDERTQCKPSHGSKQQLNPEAHYTQKQLSSHNLTLFHKKESTQLSKAQACWHKHRYTNRLLILTSFTTICVSTSVPVSILSVVAHVTGAYGLMTSEMWKLRQQVQPTQQQQAQMMMSRSLASCSHRMTVFALLS